MLNRLMSAERSFDRVRRVISLLVILGSMLVSVYELVGIVATPFTAPIGGLVGILVGLSSVIAPIVAACCAKSARFPGPRDSPVRWAP